MSCANETHIPGRVSARRLALDLCVRLSQALGKGLSSQEAPMNPLLARWFRIRDYLTEDFLGGPKVVKFAWSINLQKGGTLFFMLGLMYGFGDFSATAWTYAALHGSYGLIWLLKDRLFPDAGWPKELPVGGGGDP